MGNQKCQHETELTDVLGEEECIECVLVRLNPPLREFSRNLNESEQEEALRGAKQEFNLTDRDILLMGWVWGEWESRNL